MATGVRVRYVYPGSPPRPGGRQGGDAIVALGDTAVTDALQLRTLVANLEPKAKTTLKVERDGETLRNRADAGKAAHRNSRRLAPRNARAARRRPPKSRPPASSKSSCRRKRTSAWPTCPKTIIRDTPHGVLVVLSAPGPVDRDKLAARWKSVCEERQLDRAGAHVSRSRQMAGDRNRVHQKDARRCGRPLQHRSDAHRRLRLSDRRGDGVSGRLSSTSNEFGPSSPSMPFRLRHASCRETDPINRLAFFIGQAEKSASAAKLKQLVAFLQSVKFPVTLKTISDEARDLNSDELIELGRWLDTLDRI